MSQYSLDDDILCHSTVWRMIFYVTVLSGG